MVLLLVLEQEIDEVCDGCEYSEKVEQVKSELEKAEE